jgi:hypothetical protein
MLPAMAPGNTLAKNSPKSPTDGTFLTVAPTNMSMISDIENADLTKGFIGKSSLRSLVEKKTRLNKYDFSADNVRRFANYDSALD